ncbi:putative hydrolase of the HAD superfamily [Butyrivibrio proteoclasticus]|uniref:Putative hydrolase of the HAD superfamily n=1 Tax=Butyrivibrio proteoclasticus TaxID=43305 RepID=A0A1I5UVG3_9FIRM|nr:HAD family hydrolase [Butyrivibrio proteoclasticus]SFP99233.1 putative hydrolase of the HAD superfamily [Butyrivibrio proteoclasticus]
MPYKYKNYIFDLYGTLVDIHTDEEQPELWVRMAKKLSEEYGADYTGADLREKYLLACKEETEALTEKTHAEYPEIKIENVWAKLIGNEYAVDPCSLEALCIFFREASRDKLCKYPDTDRLLSELKSAGEKVFLLSNAQLFFTRKELEEVDIAKYFDDIFISSDNGVKKPQKEFMEKLLKKHGLNPTECVMIGNEVFSDGGVAKANGVDYIFVQDGDFSKII